MHAIDAPDLSRTRPADVGYKLRGSMDQIHGNRRRPGRLVDPIGGGSYGDCE